MMKSINQAVLGALLVSVASVSVAEEKHYMMMSGEGPQSYMMEGREHGVSDDSAGSDKVLAKSMRSSKDEHYMMLSGKGLKGIKCKASSMECQAPLVRVIKRPPVPGATLRAGIT